MNGLPATSSSAFGTSRVAAPSRVASPPASSATGTSAMLMAAASLGHDRRAREVEAEAHLAERHRGHRVAESWLVLGVEEQEAATARADQLAAERAAGHREIVPAVDLAIAHGAAPLLLVLPVDVHQLGKLPEVPALERVAA